MSEHPNKTAHNDALWTAWESLKEAERSGDKNAFEAASESIRVLMPESIQLSLEDSTGCLRKHLGRMIAANKGLLSSERDALKNWASEARVENLSEWLKGGGWDSVNADALAKALQKIKKTIITHPHTFGIDGPGENRVRVVALGWTLKDTHPDVERLVKDEKADPEKIDFLGGVDALRSLVTENHWAIPSEFLGIAKGHWMAHLAAPWLAERLERVQREEKALSVDIRPISETDAGNRWTALPRALDVASVLNGSFTVQVDGESYTPEPDFAAPAMGHILSPKGVDIVPSEWLKDWTERPEQMNLALDSEAMPPALEEYMVETATKTAHLANLGNMCPKLLGFMFACQPISGRGIKGTLGDVAQYVYPDFKDRHQQTRDLKTLGAAFVGIKGLRVVHTKPCGTRHPYDLFTLDYDLSSKADAELGWMLNPWLVERMKGGPGGGFFLLNMTRWLKMGTQNPRLFPLALRLASIWDKARVKGIYSPSHLQTIESDRLAWECNSLPEGAAKFRAGQSDGRSEQSQLIRARQKLESDLDALKEVGLLGNWEKKKVYGAGFTVRPVPPDDYAEACRRATDKIRKPKKT